jgi:hypothetical protein
MVSRDDAIHVAREKSLLDDAEADQPTA